MKTKVVRKSAFVALCLAATCSASLAQNATWSGKGTDSNWNNPENWEEGVVPPTERILHFGRADSYSVNRNIAYNVSPMAHQIIFTRDAGAYDFTGERIRLITTGLQVANYSGETQTFSSGLEFGTFGGIINTAKGDIVVENGVGGGNNRVPIKQGIGTLTIRGVSNVQLAVSIHEGTLSLDENAQSFGGVNNIVVSPNNTSIFEINGAASGVTNVDKTAFTMNIGQGAATQIRLNSNGGEGVHLNFNAASSALSWFGGSTDYGGTFNLDISSSAGNSLSFASLNSNAALSGSGVLQWATVTDSTATGFATISGSEMVRNTATTLFDGATATNNSTNYRVTGNATLTAARSLGSMTIDAAGGGAISGNYNLTTGGLLMQEGSGDYTINSTVLALTSGRLFIHQYSEDGDLILDGMIHSGVTNGFLAKTGPGTVVIGRNGRVRQSSNTMLQGGRFVLDGEIERSAEVRVFNGATLEGSGKIGSQAPSAVRIYGGGVLRGDTSGALDITGSLALDSYAVFSMTLDYVGSDFFSVSDAVALDDEVNLQLALTREAVLGESILLLKGAALTGRFATINGLDFDPDGAFTLGYDGLTYTFQIFYEDGEAWVQALSVIPEPSALLLAGVAVVSLLFARRRG